MAIDKEELNKGLRDMRNSIFEQIEFMQHVAKLESAKYLALIENGFTEEQAMEIIKARPVI